MRAGWSGQWVAARARAAGTVVGWAIHHLRDCKTRTCSCTVASMGPPRTVPPISIDEDPERFRGVVREWLEQALCGEFGGLRGVGGPGLEHEAFHERLAWTRHLAAAGRTCLGWPAEHGGRGASLAHQV